MKTKTIILSIIIFSMFFAVCFGQPNEFPAYVKNRILIKFKEVSPIADKIEELFNKKEPFKNILGDDYLDLLNQKYNLIKVEKKFNRLKDAEAINKKFPQRAKRAPKDYNPKSLDYVYMFEFAPAQAVDAKIICEEYSKDINVDYSQPIYIFHASEEPKS